MKNQHPQILALLIFTGCFFVAASFRTIERTILDYQGEQYSVKLVSKSEGWISVTTGSASGPQMIQETGGLVEILSILNPDRKVLLQDDLAGGKYEIEIRSTDVPVEDILPLVFSQVADAMGLQYVKTTVEENGICIVGANSPSQPGSSGVSKSVRSMEIGPYNDIQLEGHTLTEIKEYFLEEYEYHLMLDSDLDSGDKYNLQVKFSTLDGLLEELNEQGFASNQCNVPVPAILIKEK
jgi:hypothetical protein